mgnify:FL=1
MNIHIVVCHHNNPNKLKETISTFSDIQSSYTTTYLIDNRSRHEDLKSAVSVFDLAGIPYELIRRENQNREAGAYWHYILSEFPKFDEISRPDVVLFTQEELHQFPMAPKGRESSAENPFYPHHYGPGGIELQRIAEYLIENHKDQVGFGGRIECSHRYFDRRWRFGYWRERWKALKFSHYRFFSGACFAVHQSMLEIYRELAEPSATDFNDPYFPWMWERMWGTIPYVAGGRLVHYKDFSETVRIRYSRFRTVKALVRDLPYYISKSLGVQPKS